MKKIVVSLKLNPRILAALNVIQQKVPFKCSRTAVIESMLNDGIEACELDMDSQEVKDALEKLMESRT